MNLNNKLFLKHLNDQNIILSFDNRFNKFDKLADKSINVKWLSNINPGAGTDIPRELTIGCYKIMR